jgi:very-short-patch-repair endonuclease
MGEGKVAQRKEILDVCDSGFEREFGSRLLEMGYRLRAQVPVAGFRIDFVIEGANDTRLAVELDGDQWHGPERWADDFRRQTALERLGWTFWRCWGSSWVADRDGCLADLQRTLDRMEIGPLGAEPPHGAWTEFREASSEDAVDNTDGLDSLDPLPDSDAGLAAPPGVADEEAFVAEPGDLVAVRYNDEPNKTVTIRISPREHKPEFGIVHVSEPLAQAVLGRGIEEEIEVAIGDRIRLGVIEHIDRKTAMAA